MTGASPLDEPRVAACISMLGLASDNLLAFIALLGLLRALDHTRPAWCARVRWCGRPWTAELLLEQEATEPDVAVGANEGIGVIAEQYRLGAAGGNQPPPRDVKFTADEFRQLVRT